MSRRTRIVLAAVACCGVISAVRFVVTRPRGLTAEYFTNAEWSGPAAFSVVDSEISTDRVASHWGDSPPSIFSVRWAGYLAVSEPRVYRFSTTSDDGTRVYIDGNLVVDNGGTHGALTQSGDAVLARGAHRLVVEYLQMGGDYGVEWNWAKDDGAVVPVPSWRLSQQPVSSMRLWLGRGLDWLWIASLAAVTVVVLWTLWILSDRYRQIASLLLFVVLAIAETWPLASNPARLSRNDNNDTILNEWIVAWVAHEAPRAPGRLFDANIFYPERNTLAYSEAMLVQGAIAMPLRWAGASPVLTYNLILLAGLALTGWAVCLLVARWTADWPAAIAAGIAIGFNSHNLSRLPHLQAQHVEFFPFALVALDRLLRDPRVRHAVSLAFWFSLQALTSYYLLVIVAAALAAAIIVRPDAWRRADVLRSLGIAAGVSGLALAPYLWPYWRAYRDQGFTRPAEDLLAATWRDYLTTPARFDHWLLGRWSSYTALFPGFVALAFAAVAIGSGIGWKDRRARMCLALGACGVALSFGTALPGYSWLYRVFLPLHGVRAVERFGYLGIVAVGLLGAFGIAHVRERCRSQRLLWTRTAIAVVVPALVFAESLAAPIAYTPYKGVSRLYRQVAGDADGVVAELPLPEPRVAFANAPYMLNSTVSWNPLLNGFSGFVPGSYQQHYDALRGFPDARSLSALKAFGVRYVFVHTDLMNAEAVKGLEHTRTLEQIAADGAVILYRVNGV